VDGIGINSSRDVRISDCDVDTGDDAIIIKCSHDDLTCERVTVTNCVLSTNCAAVGIGAEVRGRINDVVFSHCVVKRSLRMIQIELWHPGHVQRILFSGITGRTIPDEGIENERPIYIDIQQHNRPEPVLGEASDIICRDILCESRGRIVMTAQDGSVIDGITLENVIVSVPEIEDPQEVVPRAVSLQLSNFNPQTRAVRAAVVADNVNRLTLKHVEFTWSADPNVGMHALCFRNVTDIIDESPRLRPNQRSLERITLL
jgi:polygalacturonase